MASLFPKEKYIQYLPTCDALSDKVTVDTPMELNVHLCASDNEPLFDLTRYRHLVGSLVYFDITLPDIPHPIHILSQLSLLSLQSTAVTSIMFYDTFM